MLHSINKNTEHRALLVLYHYVGPRTKAVLYIFGDLVMLANRAVPFVLFMLLVVLLIAFIPAVSTLLLPDTYK